ncbi:MAG TPA: TetR/AcrR family transcriptional regulator [Candidatus Thalassarchaeaceae archaeon]|jgi:AcrR family transcriptional regulator|nr:TetR/AcrR family transcriptional regulator [Candidatus Thalassarchaeaceae archaeon]
MGRIGKITRESIVEVATVLMHEHGYLGMTLEDVAKRLGITRPALYYYYSRKDELLLDIHQRARERLVSMSTELYKQELEPIETFYLYIYNHCLVVTEHAPVISVMFDDVRHLAPEERGNISRQESESMRQLTETYIINQKDGYFRDDTEARLAVATMVGACNWISRWFKPGGWSPEYVATSTATNLIRGIATPAGIEFLASLGLINDS